MKPRWSKATPSLKLVWHKVSDEGLSTSMVSGNLQFGWNSASKQDGAPTKAEALACLKKLQSL